MNYIWLILLGLIILILIIRTILAKKPVSDYDKLYNEILTSDKYKVKGQYDWPKRLKNSIKSLNFTVRTTKSR